MAKQFVWEKGIEYARYVSEDRKNIEILYIVNTPTTTTGRKAKITVIPVNENDAQFKALLNHFSVDQIMEMTYNYNKDAKAAFEREVLEIARKNGSITATVDMATEDFVKKFMDIVFKEGLPAKEEKEVIFKTKLQLFELDLVRSSKKRTLKSKLRKAKTLLEILAVMYELQQAEASKETPQA